MTDLPTTQMNTVLHRLTIGCWLIGASLSELLGSYGGEIAYTHLGDLTYRITLDLYTRPEDPEDQQSVMIEFGDGSTGPATRMEVEDRESATCSSRRSRYMADHTYQGPGAFVIRYVDGFFPEGLVDLPNSGNLWQCISALLVIDPVLGPNNSLVMSNSHWNFSHAINTLIHNLGASEQDGDDLVFSIGVPLGDQCDDVEGYSFPQPPSDILVAWTSGDLAWIYVANAGTWFFRITCDEYRNGALIGSVARGITICRDPTTTYIPNERPIGSLLLSPSVTDGLVQLTGMESDARRILVHDSSGRMVLDEHQPAGSSTIDLSSLPSGPYLIRAEAQDGTVGVGQVIKR